MTNKKVIIEIHKDVITDLKIPKGITVEVRNYDVSKNRVGLTKIDKNNNCYNSYNYYHE